MSTRDTSYGEDESKTSGGIRKAFTSAVRRVSMMGRRTSSAQPNGKMNGSTNTLDSDRRNSSRIIAGKGDTDLASKSSRLSWNPRNVAETDLYGDDADEETFELSMEDEIFLPTRPVPMSIETRIAVAGGSIANTVDASPLGGNRRLSKNIPSTNMRSGSNLSVNSNVSNPAGNASNGYGAHILMAQNVLGLPASQRSIASAVSVGEASSSAARRSSVKMVDFSSIPVSSVPVPITAEEASRTPRASLIPVPDVSLLPKPTSRRSSLKHNAGLVTPPRTSSLAQNDAFSASQSPQLPPPVAPRDRRRSGMPDAFAVPIEAIAMANADHDLVHDAAVEPIHGDPKFEPYRDMLREGATEIEVAEAMRFFGVSYADMFGRDVLAEAGLSIQEPTRNTMVWIEKKIESDRKRGTLTEVEATIKARSAAAQAAELAVSGLGSADLAATESSVLGLEVIGSTSASVVASTNMKDDSDTVKMLMRDAEKRKKTLEIGVATSAKFSPEEEAAFTKYHSDLAHLDEDEEDVSPEEDAAVIVGGIGNSRAFAQNGLDGAEQSSYFQVSTIGGVSDREEIKKAEEAMRVHNVQEEEENARKSEATKLEAEERMRHQQEEERRLKALEARIEKEREKSESMSTDIRSGSAVERVGASSTSIDSPSSAALAEIEGNLMKKTKGGQWHTRAFTLRGKELSWVKSDGKTIARLALNTDSHVRDVPVGLKKFMFEVTSPGSGPLMLSANGATEKTEWIKAIQFAITGVLPPATLSTKGSLMALQSKGKVTAQATAVMAKASATHLPKPPPRPQSDRGKVPGTLPTVSAAGITSNYAAIPSVVLSSTKKPAPSAAITLTPVTSPMLPQPPTLARTQQANDKLAEKLSQVKKVPQTMCSSCGAAVYKMEEVTLKNAVVLHRKCFMCSHCRRQLTLANFVQHDNKLYCQSHYNELVLDQAAERKSGAAPVVETTSDSLATSIPLRSPITTIAPVLPEVKLEASATEMRKPQISGRIDSNALASMLTKKPSFMKLGLPNAGTGAVRSVNNVTPIEMDNSMALSKPIVPAGRRRKPSMLPQSSAVAKTQLGTEPTDRMTSECTFKVLIDPSAPTKVLWMHASSRFERDQWINCLCNAIQALDMKRALTEAQTKDMASAVQSQVDLEDFLSRNEVTYAGFCEKLSIKSHRNWKRRWFELTDKGEIKYSEDDSKRAKSSLQLSHRSVVLDANDTRLSGPLALKQ